MAEREQVDLVLLDFNMPGLSGLDVLRTIRQKHSKLALPVILVTGRTDDADVLDALNSGANDWCDKPVVPLILLARGATHLSMKVENLNTFRKKDGIGLNIDSIDAGTVLADERDQKPIESGGFGDTKASLNRAKRLRSRRSGLIYLTRMAVSSQPRAGSNLSYEFWLRHLIRILLIW